VTENSRLSNNLRRQPKQQRSKQRVEAILDAAATLFDENGYNTVTTHQIAARAGTAIGSLYQFFPDKQAIFHEMELRHIDRVKDFWAQTDAEAIARLPLPEMIHLLTLAVAEIFSHPDSRVVFVQFFLSREIFQSIDDTMTADAIDFMADILAHRNPSLPWEQCHLRAEVCVHTSNALIFAAFRTPNLDRRQQLHDQIEESIVAYLTPDFGDPTDGLVMKVMKCPYCQSTNRSKNGRRRGKQSYLCKDCGKQYIDRLPN
jgi:AcrR family transcriptional regulator